MKRFLPCAPLLALLLATLMQATIPIAVMPALALTPDEQLSDPAKEGRAREIGKELRCVVCQNQSINESDADLAKDLRRLVRERIQAGEDDQAVIDHIVDRYGDFVLMRPPVKASTYILWATPAVLLLAGIAILVSVLRRRRAGPPHPAPLSEAERQRARALLANTTLNEDR